MTGVVLRVGFHGKRLARMVSARLNERIRGTIEIGSIEWPTSALPKIITGGWIEVTIHDVKVLDEDKKLVLQTQLATAELDAHPAIFGRHDLVLRNIRIPEGGYAKIRQIAEPYPAHEFDYYAVSLISAFYPKLAPAFRAGLSARPAPVFDLRDYHVRGITMEFEFPQFSAIAYGIHGDGALRFDGSDPLAKKLYYSLAPKAPLAVFRAGGAYEVLTDVDVERLALVPTRWPAEMVPRDLEYRATADTTSGARIRLAGAMLDHWVDFFGGEHRVSLVIDNAKLASRLAAADALGPDSSSTFAADRVAVDVTGPVMAPRVSLELSDVDIEQKLPDQPPLELNLTSAKASFDLATESGTLEDTSLVGLGGEVDLAADFSLRPLSFHAQLDINKPLELAPYLPPTARRVAGTKLSGHLHAVGNPQIQRLERLDLRLGRAKLEGKAYRTSTGMIHADGIHASLGRTTARNIRGSLNSSSREVDVHMDISSSDLARLLRRLGAPELAQRVRGYVHVGGTLDDIRAGGRLSFSGVPVLEKLDAELSFADQRLRVDAAHSDSFGGKLSAHGRIDLHGVPRFQGFTISGDKLSLGSIPGAGSQLSGQASLRAHLSGPVFAPDAEAELGLADWSVAGDRYRDTTIHARATLGGAMALEGELEREAGGKLSIDAHVAADRRLSGKILLGSLPIEGALGTAGVPAGTAGGTLSSHLDLSGTLAEPTASGSIQAIRSWLGNAFLGLVDLHVERVERGLVHISGRLLQGRIVIDGTLGTVSPFEADFEVRFHRLEADQFYPVLAEKYGTRAWVSGTLEYRGDLLPTSRRRPQLSAKLTELVALIDNEDAEGRPAPVRIASKSPIEISYDGVKAVLDTPAVLDSPGGDLRVSGSATANALDVKVKGTVDLALLQRYAGDNFEGVAGKIALDIEASGAPTNPQVSAKLDLQQVAVKPAGQDAIVTVPQGRIELSNEQVTATGLSVVVVDQYSDEAASLDITGGVRLEHFLPADWTVVIDGELAGKMLLVAAPEQVSSASGKARMTLALSGTGLYPNIDGTIEFSKKDSLTFTPRGLRREIRLTGGVLRFTDQLVQFDELTGWVDDEGLITNLSGELNHEAGRPSSLDLTLSARDLPFRIPQTLALSVNLDRVSIVGDFAPEVPLSERLEIAGAVEIVDGRYLEDWNQVINNLRPQRTSESAPPLWERVPVLGNARLDLDVASPAFLVRNNIADITLSGNLDVGGTPLKPRIGGTIRVEEGSFKFPGIRAKFTRTSGSVDFSNVRDFPEQTPTLKIVSESDYRDLRGQNHLVQLRLTGPIENLDWDLTTADGLNRSQTLSLIISGRTPADFRRLLGDEAVGKRPGDFDNNVSTVSSEGTAAVLDRLAKDLVGDQFNLLVGDRLRNLTKFDVVRIELGTASWGIHTEKELTESLRLTGEAAWTLQGWSATGSLENRFNDTLSIDVNGLAKRFNDEALDDQNDLTTRLTWRKVLLP